MTPPRQIQRESVEAWLRDGCGRCDLYRTPDCKVHRSAPALRRLLALVRETELAETLKWGQPCFTLGGKNIVMVGALRDHCMLSFFQGAALADPEGLLEPAGPNSRIARLIRFRSAAEVESVASSVARLLTAAIAQARVGARVPRPESPEPLPDVLSARLAEDAELRAAFARLTPGRQRSHGLHIGGAKQHETRLRRLARCIPKILAGKGFQER